MEIIIRFIEKVGTDKVIHFALSFLVSVLAAAMAKVLGCEPFTVMAVAWFAGFIAGLAKEIHDEIEYHSADSRDWIADVLGTTLGTLVSLIFAL